MTPGGAATLAVDTREFAAIAHEVVGMVGAARTALSADPGLARADLAGAGLGFLTELIEPLQRCLDHVGGDATSLRAKAEEWTALAGELRECGPRTAMLAASTRDTWTGAAADAFDTTMTEFARTIDGAATSCDGVTVLLRTSADLMAGARHLISEGIARVVDYMIVAEASAEAAGVLTAGGSEAAALSAILGRVSAAVERSIDIVERAGLLLERIARALSGLSRSFADISGLLTRLAGLHRGLAAPAHPLPPPSSGSGR